MRSPRSSGAANPGMGEAPYEGHRDGHADGGRDEVLHREATGLHDVAHGLFAGVRLPVGVGDEGRRRVERLVRIDRGEAERAGQCALEPLQQIEEEDAHRGEGEHSPQIRGPAHLRVRVGAYGLVHPLLDAQVLVRGVDGGHVVAERAVRQPQRHEEREDLEHTGEDGAHIALRTSPGREGRGRGSPGGRRPRPGRRCSRRSQLRHPLATRATSAKTAIVVTTKATSAIVCS